MSSASASHRRVEPSTSVNKNVTTPEGAAAAAADTPAESHNRPAPTTRIGGNYRAEHRTLADSQHAQPGRSSLVKALGVGARIDQRESVLIDEDFLPITAR